MISVNLFNDGSSTGLKLSGKLPKLYEIKIKTMHLHLNLGVLQLKF